MHVLRTERLLLRWFSADDAAFVLALVNDPGWLEHIGDRGLRTEEDARAWIETRLVGGCVDFGFGFWAMEGRSDGVLLGMCGLVHRASLPTLDVGYALAPIARGRGYAREGAAACLAYARDVLREPRVLAITGPTNAASIRVLESIGMRHEKTVVLDGETRQSAVFSWAGAESGVDGDLAQIDDVARRLFSAFDNRGGAIAHVAALPSIFLRDAVVSWATLEPEGLKSASVREFITPRAALLETRLREFSERETEARTDICGAIAQRWCRYEKSGTLDGAPYRGIGTKTMQLVRTTEGRWKIAALAWQDDREDI